MSKLSPDRLMELAATRILSQADNEQTTPTKNGLSEDDKRKIWWVLAQTKAKVVELIELLNSFDKRRDGEKIRFYWRSQWQLQKIRPLKNEVVANYFAVWEVLRTHKIGSDELIEKYYRTVRSLKDSRLYPATELQSQTVIDFHKSIEAIIWWVLKKALK